MKPFRLAVPAMALLALSLLARPAWSESYPKAVQLLIDRGVEIAGSFEAPGGMTGYVADMQGQPVAFYLTPDGKHVVIGPMLTEDGENLTDPKIQELVQGPKNKEAWKQVENSHWVRDGDKDAPVILYTFTDPNCPFCHRFRQAAAPWIEAGRVQLRHVLVGILKQDSLPKAATILGSEDPQEALHENQQRYNDGGITVDRQIVSAHHEQITTNNRLMGELGLSATPSTFYRDNDGKIQMKQGLPRPQEMVEIMGSEKP